MSDETKHVKVSLADGVQCAIETRGHDILADEPADKGGGDTGATPTEIFLGGLGACTAMTLKMYCNVKKWALEGVTIDVTFSWVEKTEWPDWPEAEERDKVPLIRRKIRVRGDFDEKQVERLHYIANRCPVHRAVTENPYVADDLALA